MTHGGTAAVFCYRYSWKYCILNFISFQCNFKCYVSEVLLWVKNNLATSGIPFKYSTVHFPLVPSGTTLKVNGAPLGDTSSSTAVTKTASFSVQSVLTLLVKVGQWSLKSSTWMAMVPVAVFEGKSTSEKEKRI